ncbi:MAG: SDR family NAD(P)-dependent oxidoreductase [Xanthobacteraceae bacterium]|nr:SDR family NAD(P)-dependent oxidoreductase [Xanthobacteraceae bacterium]
MAEPAAPRTVVITGASSGIGRALARRYARDGARLGLLGRDRSRLEEACAQCRQAGVDVRTGLLDVRARDDMAAWLDDLDDAWPIDLLIANAGIMVGSPGGGVVEAAEDSHRAIEINVIGVLNAVHPILPRMIARGHGQIAVMSSLAGFIPLADAPSYCASKAAVLSYGLGLRGAVEDKGIRVSVVCPGYVDTPMIAQETGWQPFKMSAEAAADETVRGLAANRAVIAFPSFLATVSWIGGQLPDRVRRFTARPFAFKVSSRPGS